MREREGVALLESILRSNTALCYVKYALRPDAEPAPAVTLFISGGLCTLHKHEPTVQAIVLLAFPRCFASFPSLPLRNVRNIDEAAIERATEAGRSKPKEGGGGGQREDE